MDLGEGKVSSHHCIPERDSRYIQTHGHITISTTSEAWIYARAKGRLADFAVAATSISDIEGHDNTVTLLQQADTTPHFLNYAHVLMT